MDLRWCWRWAPSRCRLRRHKQVKGAGDSSPAGVGFSIESEMLTYRALESNSEAIACDVTAFLNGTSANFTSPPAGMVCDVKAGSHNVGIVLLPFDKSTFADFQLWRADMVTMDRLQRKSATFDCPPGAQSKAAVSAASSALMLTPAGPMLNAAQGVLGLLASEEVTSPVTGTIQDQAFMNSVGRQLRALKVPVIMPTGYSPYSLAPLDQTTSPFLAGVGRLLSAEGCLTALAAKGGGDNPSLRETIAEIDKFRGMLDEVSASGTKTTGEGSDKAAGALPATPSSVAPATSSSHLPAVLFADGLAQALGVDPATGKLPENGVSQHILLPKRWNQEDPLPGTATFLARRFALVAALWVPTRYLRPPATLSARGMCTILEDPSRPRTSSETTANLSPTRASS